jgi:hypothetical protein
MGINMVTKDRIISGLILSIIAILPIIFVFLFWIVMKPVGFWQTLAMMLVSIPLYIVFIFIELVVIDVIS